MLRKFISSSLFSHAIGADPAARLSEPLGNAIAVSLAVLTVATVALLMGAA